MKDEDIDVWVTLNLTGRGPNPYLGELGRKLQKVGVKGPWQGTAKERSAFVPAAAKWMQKQGYSIKSMTEEGLKEVRLFQNNQPTTVFVRKMLTAGEKSMPRDAVPLISKIPDTTQLEASIGLANHAKTAVGTSMRLAAQSTKPVTAGGVPASQTAASLGIAGYVAPGA